jgi:hypothetical protein
MRYRPPFEAAQAPGNRGGVDATKRDEKRREEERRGEKRREEERRGETKRDVFTHSG